VKTNRPLFVNLLLICSTLLLASDFNYKSDDAFGKEVSTEKLSMGNHSGKTYYISASLGSDSNDGLSSKFPWKSLEKIYLNSFRPGNKHIL